MAARNPAAYELWNNEIARDDSTLMRTGAPDAVAERIAECVAFLQQQLLARRMFRRDKLILELCVEQCGEFHRSVYLRAFADLLTTGWERDPGPVGSAWIRRL